jgi:hypothetical protein
MHKPAIDRRVKLVQEATARAYPQMLNYFQCRYSWGQPCDPKRAADWATLAGYLATCNHRAQRPGWHEVMSWPSGNTGSPAGMVEIYHDGWQLLADLGLYDLED